VNGGKTARYGFAFQDLILCQRILAYILARRAALIESKTVPTVRFGVEASPETGAPEWDLLQQDGETVVLEEAKSGEFSASGRRDFWRRVRGSLRGFGLQGSDRIVLKLTVNADSLPSKADHWRQFGKRCERMALAATPPEVPAEPPRQVRTVEDLVMEALRTLLAPDVDGSASPLLVKECLCLLSRFEFNDLFSAASVEDEVDRLVAAISRDVGIREMHDLLRGEIARRAESPDRQCCYFTIDDIVGSISILERLSQIDPATLRRWKALQSSCALVREVCPPAGQGLAYQEWRTLQPIAAQLLDTTTPVAVAIVGRGGIANQFSCSIGLQTERPRVTAYFS